jgi:hypothetical protein
MIIIDSNGKELEIKNSHWPLAEDLFYKWDMVPNINNEIFIKSVHDIAPELSAWGIPWRYI